MPSFISSLQHPLIKHLVKLRQNGTYRDEHKSIVIEGLKPILEICQQIKPKTILTCRQDLLNLLPAHLQADRLFLCTETVMQKATGLAQSEGVMIEIAQPIHPNFDMKRSILVLDSINDPGNLGTLLRTALALDWDGAYIVGNSCDPYNEKAIRASRGACLNLPWRQSDWKELKMIASCNSLLALLADLNGELPKSFPQDQGIMLILSNEAQGPSKEPLEWAKKVSIPLSKKVESLNVAIAGGILMYIIRGDEH